MHREEPILIAGAGLSGLACALTLQKENIPYLIFDSAERVGGRIKSDRTAEGFILDRGFQVLLNSYPSLTEFLDLDTLNLRRFSSGALIYGKDSNRLLANPFRHPARSLGTLFSSAPTISDKLKVATLVIRSQSFSQMNALSGQTTFDYLRDYGFSDKFIRNFWSPFLAGVFLDPSLSIDANFFLFLIRCFGLGSVSVPALGMEEIPKQMLSRLASENVHLASEIVTIEPNHIELRNGKRISGRATLQTYSPEPSNDRSVTTFYFSAAVKPEWKKWLLLVPPGLGFSVNHVALMSEVAPDYAPPGKVLISASVLSAPGNPSAPPSASSIQDEINELAKNDLNLSHLRTDWIRHALPELKSSPDFIRENERYFCGDFLSSPSIDGALKSGKAVALEIARRRI